MTIRSKFSWGLFIIFSLAFLVLNYSIRTKIYNNNENVITNEMNTLKENCNVFIRQEFMINDYNNEEVYFEKLSNDIVNELVDVIKSEVGVYTVDGELLYSSNEEKFTHSNFRDIDNAVNDKVSYTIQNGKDRTEIYFSYPVIIVGNKVGILRIIKDYSLLYEQGNEIVTSVLYITSFIFVIAFLFSYLLSRNITVPLIKLTKASTEAAKGNLDIKINSSRKDEIGELSTNFDHMIEKINTQIETIKKDRDDLEQLIHHKKHFYDNVTHELKTPLTSIVGYAQMIKQNQFTDKDFFDKGMNHIINESKRLNAMVLNLLELSKQTSEIDEAFKMISLEKLLDDICEAMYFKAERYGNTIDCKTEKDLFIEGSLNHLKQVFINIIDNAIKYGLSNTVIQVLAYSEGEFAYIDIINKGEGIPSKEIEEIFLPFYRMDKQKSREMGSCGLGLSISKEIVKKHKGEIKIHSVKNKETSVLIKLPRYKC